MGNHGGNESSSGRHDRHGDSQGHDHHHDHHHDHDHDHGNMTEDEQVKFFEKIADEYDQQKGVDGGTEFVAKFLRGQEWWSPPMGPILDFGAGTGNFLMSIEEDLVDQGNVALDVSIAMLNKFKEKIEAKGISEKFHIVDLDVQEPDQIVVGDGTKPSKFPLISMLNVSHHLRDPPKILALLIESYLADQGRFALLDFAADDSEPTRKMHEELNLEKGKQYHNDGLEGDVTRAFLEGLESVKSVEQEGFVVNYGNPSGIGTTPYNMMFYLVSKK